MLLVTCIRKHKLAGWADEGSKAHLRAVLNDRVRLRSQVEVRVFAVVNANLVRLNEDLRVGGEVNKCGPRVRAHVDLAPRHLPHVNTLHSEWEHNCAVSQVFQDEVLFPQVLGLTLGDLLTRDITNQQVVSRVVDFESLLNFIHLHGLLLGFGGRFFPGEGKLLFWNRFFFFLLMKSLELCQLSLKVALQLDWNGI